jgi:hypothetical protein
MAKNIERAIFCTVREDAGPFSVRRYAMSNLRSARWLVALALLLPSACEDASGGRCAVSGTVSFKGKPLDQGNILFIPISSNLQTQSGTSIANGSYAISKSNGLVPGRYRVSMSSGDGVTPAGPSDQAPGPSGNFSSKERIPKEYNIASTQEVVVKSEGPNRFDFDIP